MPKPLSLILPQLDPVWCYEYHRFQAMKQRLDEMDFALSLQLPANKRGVRAGVSASWDDDDYDDEDDLPPKPYQIDNGVALFNLRGPLTKYYNWLSYYYGGTATSLYRKMVQMATADPDVTSAVQVVDSGGGQVAGTADAAADLKAFGAVKPLVTLIEDNGYSAAYWLSCVAPDGVYLNNSSGGAGSTGTIMVTEDTSEAAKKQGVIVHAVASGDLKGIGTDGTKITEAQLAYLQSYIDAVNVAFMSAVRTSRKMSDAQMKEISRAGLYVGDAAISVGLVDGYATLDECKKRVRALADLRQKTTTHASLSINTRAQSLPDPTAQEGTPPADTAPIPSPAVSATLTVATDTNPQPSAAPPASINSPQRSQPAITKPGGEGTPMKDTLVRVLAALGLHKMAVAVVSTTNDTPESLAQTMSEQVNAEVKDRISSHPLMLACAASGIATPNDLGHMLEMKQLGEQYLQDLRSDAKAEAIRAYGPEAGQKIGATVDRQGHHEIKALLVGWRTEADKKFGIAADGTAPARVSASSANLALNAEETIKEQTPKTAWEQLSAEQQGIAAQMGHAKTAEDREKFARTYLGNGK